MRDVLDLVELSAHPIWSARPQPTHLSGNCRTCKQVHDEQYKDLVAIGIDVVMAKRMSETAGFHPPCQG
jgi:hypothetical protein